ncbi:hypothetical protein C8R43DRAFT_898602, partial [Mycena crocata]
GAQTLSPPVSSCIQPGCNSDLDEESVVEGRLFTLRRGVLPIFSKSKYCRSCQTRYYNNYFVHQASKVDARRQYYSEEVPTYIHIHETSYIDTELCKYFSLEMALSHGTCSGIAKVYNKALGSSSLPNSSRLSHELTGDLVLDSFIHYSLLHDKKTRREILSLPHGGHQNHRYDEAMAERNYRMAGTGQAMWAHACNRCMKIYKGDDGQWYRLTAGVHDGVTVRHLCCSVHDCLEALPSQRDHFCFTHRALAAVCCVQGCNAASQPGFKTCSLEAHRALQTAAEEKNTAMFQLRSRLRHAASSAPPPAVNSTTDPPPVKLKAKLTRNYTHNEQLFVRCCGVIISRATLFGSEGVTGAKVFLKATFPPQYPGAKPSYVFYDNNCSFLKHLRASGDHYFDDVGLPVDVFHFKCKHSEGDLFCQTHCNPARFKELIDSDGKWVFNSSAAEQANVWFGKYQNIVQEMPVLKYNFYLDEMIALHNENVTAELVAEGHAPHIQPESLLRGGFPFLQTTTDVSTA